MSHSKEDEDIEDIQCILDHTKILHENITNINFLLVSAKTMPSKKEVMTKLEETLLEAKSIVKRLNYMIEDMKN